MLLHAHFAVVRMSCHCFFVSKCDLLTVGFFEFETLEIQIAHLERAFPAMYTIHKVYWKHQSTPCLLQFLCVTNFWNISLIHSAAFIFRFVLWLGNGFLLKNDFLSKLKLNNWKISPITLNEGCINHVSVACEKWMVSTVRGDFSECCHSFNEI